MPASSPKFHGSPRSILEEKLARQLAEVSRAERFLVGVSGGRDSVVLLTVLAKLGFTQLVVAHVNHRLRGADADADEQFVQTLALAHGYVYHALREDVAGLAKEQKKSIEAVARQVRYAFFAKVAVETGCVAVFTGHHADDQVETFLLNLFRGAARAGLGGMSFDSVQQLPSPSVGETGVSDARFKPLALRILRPMLGVWREEIDAYAVEHGIQHCEDASNASSEYTRNRIRHELIPKLRTIFERDVRGALLRSADVFQAEEEWLSALFPVPSEQAFLSTVELKAQAKAMQRRVIYQWLRQQSVPDVGFEEVEAVRGLLEGKRAKVNLPGNWFARRREKRIFLEKGAIKGGETE